jgi:hypothetical protein
MRRGRAENVGIDARPAGARATDPKMSTTQPFRCVGSSGRDSVRLTRGKASRGLTAGGAARRLR